jgi:hypothetical protein
MYGGIFLSKKSMNPIIPRRTVMLIEIYDILQETTSLYFDLLASARKDIPR